VACGNMYTREKRQGPKHTQMLTVERKRHTTIERQQEIVDAARRLIIKDGSEHITVRRIAAETGISEGAIYRHFKSKKDILLLMVGNIEDTWVADIEKSRIPGRTPLDVLDATILNRLSTIEQRRGVSFLVMAEIISLGDKALNARISSVISRFNLLIRDILSDGVKSGQIRPDLDLDAAAALFFGMLQGTVSIWALNEYRFNVRERCLSSWRILREAVVSSPSFL